ncbi:hypothetical protein [Streptomyces europaeiscabiei]|uniref:hypothetical protein n=1 Tax=Streptomyces europaeiscabiei TaxID=146819 RepID=UPI000765B841|nr:hypothetical protein [Streptomyces europaeiscabiei]MDX2757448.1 hypothetical protein [Streptomyces europaeiscabiei]MDX3867598.1 hypothetical protein [Streptomyces europaeiscabiei]MDX3876797.1 hypothetical protein [Streptomyces europaeiscabiei]
MSRPFTGCRLAHVLTVIGALLTLCGSVMWVLPGPGLPVLVLGILCLAAAGIVLLTGRSR